MSNAKTAGGIAAGVLTVLLIIGMIALKLGARALTKAVARGSSSSSSWDFGTSSAPTWDEVLAEKNRVYQEIIDEALALRAAHNNNVPFDIRNRFMDRVREKATKLQEMANNAERKYGPPSPTMMASLREVPSVEHLQSNFSSSSPSSALADMQAQMEARRQQQEADRQARQQEYENARQAAEQRAAEQREADRIAREQRMAEQQARDQERRDRLNAMANNQPPPFVPPQFNPPQFNPPAPAAEPQQPEAPPGFPAVDLAQIKLKDNVFVSDGDKWLPAIVTLKRGKLVQVRSVANGAVAVVTLDRIRLQNEPVAKANAALPGALQAVERKPATGDKNQDENDDALFIAKPPAKDEPEPSTPTPATTPPASPSPAASIAAEPAVRTWSDSTGEFKVAAELVGFEFGLVQLKRQDGKILSVPLEKLSATDQQLVREKYK